MSPTKRTTLFFLPPFTWSLSNILHRPSFTSGLLASSIQLLGWKKYQRTQNIGRSYLQGKTKANDKVGVIINRSFSRETLFLYRCRQFWAADSVDFIHHHETLVQGWVQSRALALLAQLAHTINLSRSSALDSVMQWQYFSLSPSRLANSFLIEERGRSIKSAFEVKRELGPRTQPEASWSDSLNDFRGIEVQATAGIVTSHVPHSRSGRQQEENGLKHYLHERRVHNVRQPTNYMPNSPSTFRLYS